MISIHVSSCEPYARPFDDLGAKQKIDWPETSELEVGLPVDPEDVLCVRAHPRQKPSDDGSHRLNSSGSLAMLATMRRALS
jgi:hypothetical protein